MKIYYSHNTRGFYNSLVSGLNIPADAVEISKQVHQELLAGQAEGKIITPDNNGKPVLSDHPYTFESSIDVKNKEIISAYKQAMAPIKANYTDEDIASFPTQETEAKAWDADNNAETPLLDYMLANRPTVDKATLVSRILQNAVVYKQIAGPAIGKKQYLEDQLYALKAQHEDPDQPDVTQADIDAIVVDFSTS